jgi:excisionase family DNA binding protein
MTGRRARYLTTDQMAELVSVRPKTIRVWIDRGLINAVKLNRRWRIPAGELDRLLEAESHGE